MVRPMLSDRCLSCLSCPVLSVCDVGLGLLWPNGWMDQDETWHEVGFGPGHIVLDGDPATPPKKGAEPPIFDPYLLWQNGCMHEDATWQGGRPQPKLNCLRCGPTSPPQNGAVPPIFNQCLLGPNGWMDQDATW